MAKDADEVAERLVAVVERLADDDDVARRRSLLASTRAVPSMPGTLRSARTCSPAAARRSSARLSAGPRMPPARSSTRPSARSSCAKPSSASPAAPADAALAASTAVARAARPAVTLSSRSLLSRR